MIKFFILTLSTLTLLSSCDPFYLMYIKNETGETVKVHVEFENRYDIKFDSLRCTTRDFTELKPKHIRFMQLKKPININKDSYSFAIEENETVLLEPVTIGEPILRVIYETKAFSDTIFEYGDWLKYKDLKRKGIILKKGLSTRMVYLRNIEN